MAQHDHVYLWPPEPHEEGLWPLFLPPSVCPQRLGPSPSRPRFRGLLWGSLTPGVSLDAQQPEEDKRAWLCCRNHRELRRLEDCAPHTRLLIQAAQAEVRGLCPHTRLLTQAAQAEVACLFLCLPKQTLRTTLSLHTQSTEGFPAPPEQLRSLPGLSNWTQNLSFLGIPSRQHLQQH